MKTSKLSEHKVIKGKVISPMNFHFDNLVLNSWADERLPHYLWLGLILDDFEREEGMIKIEKFLFDISPLVPSVETPSILEILELDDATQKRVYQKFMEHFDANSLFPLTAIFGKTTNNQFYRYFFNQHSTLSERLLIIEDAIARYSYHQSNEATDLRYLTISFAKERRKIFISRDCGVAVDAFLKYPITPHGADEMRLYRASIRSMEGARLSEFPKRQSEEFWRRITELTDCKLMKISHQSNEDDAEIFLNEVEDYLSRTFALFRNDIARSAKHEVLCGILAYSINILREIIQCKIKDKILGRSANRMICESYAITKYLIINQDEHQSIWQDYKIDGIGKFKLILLKMRESKNDWSLHVNEAVLGVICNEEIGEEFLNADLGYFNKHKIREKFIQINEKEMFDISYDYDSQYSHGLWGAIRESSMLSCDNPGHKHHRFPDFNSQQVLMNVLPECIHILKKHIECVAEELNFPKIEYGQK